MLPAVYFKLRLTFDDLPSPLNEPPRSFTTTLAPREAKNRAYALPRPPPAPVTTTVWPSKRSGLDEDSAPARPYELCAIFDGIVLFEYPESVYSVEEKKKRLEDHVYIKVSSNGALMISSFGAH